MVAEPKPRPDPTPPTLPDGELIDALVHAKAEAERIKAEYEKLQYEVRLRIQEKPGRTLLQSATHVVTLKETWSGRRYDETKLVQFHEKVDIATGELLYAPAWIPEDTKVVPGYWDTNTLKALAKKHGDSDEVDAAKMEPTLRVSIEERK
jgi:predicted metalloprotease